MTTLKERLNKILFARCVKGVMNTAPLQRGAAPITALSMVHARDVLPYLLAIKTFSMAVQPERIVVVADPSISPDDRRTLRQHVPFVELLDAVDFRAPSLPTGGCWERLSAISKLNCESAIVQVDADTLTTGPLEDLALLLASGSCAVLRSERGVEIVSASEAAEKGKELRSRSQHIQVVCESELDRLPNAHVLRYVRGCAGFTAFAKAAISQAQLVEFSAAMQTIHGARWNEWGSEQFASNLLAASAPRCALLPHPKYCNADSKTADTHLTHYIGYARYTSRTYEADAKRMMSALNRGAWT